DVAARISRQLDLLPLAIELAAARASTLEFEEIENHLADKFAFLTHRRRAAEPRHQALRTAIDWSYDQLTDGERVVFRALAMFAGSFDRQAAAAVCPRPGDRTVFEAVDGLAAKSLLVAEPSAGQTRYRMLETIREYATALLRQAGEAE